MSAPSVYLAINAISAELAKSGIPKRHINEVDDYKYRSIDDLLTGLAPLLATQRLCVLPRVIDREVAERTDEDGRLLQSSVIRVAYVLTSAEDGSSHEVETFGEALDTGDKATAKALTAAYKSAMVQIFCIPVPDQNDPDRTTYKLRGGKTHPPKPVQGWAQWCVDIEDIISLCESEQALATVQERNRALLKALSREQPKLYARVGKAFAGQRENLSSMIPPLSEARRGRPAKVMRKPRTSKSLEREHA